jgi:hypothetical protein
MRICTRFFIFFLIGCFALTSVGCSSSKGSYGNSSHHKSSKKKKSSSTKSAPKSSEPKTTEPQDTDNNSPENKGTGGYKSNPQGNVSPKKEEVKRLGYGLNLGALQFAGSQFQLGLTPNMAYKIQENFAVGFMLKVDYYYFKDSYYDLTYSSFGLGPTVFTRWKPLWSAKGVTPFMQGLFLQAEYEHATISQPYDEFGNIITNGNKIVGVRRWEDYVYLGIGASSGYPFASFFSIHYNILDDINHTRVPFNWRLGFTWNY